MCKPGGLLKDTLDFFFRSGRHLAPKCPQLPLANLFFTEQGGGQNWYNSMARWLFCSLRIVAFGLSIRPWAGFPSKSNVFIFYFCISVLPVSGTPMPQNAARQGQVLPQSGPYSCVFILYIMLLCNMYHSLYGDSWARLLALQTWIWAHFHERDCVTRLLPHFLWSKLSSWALYKQVNTICQFFYFSGYLLWKKQQVKFKNSKIARLYSCWLRRYGDSLVMDDSMWTRY